MRLSGGHLCANHRNTDRGGSRELEPVRVAPQMFEGRVHTKQKNQTFRSGLVRETGLEPVRDYHTPLKRARLPIPPLSLVHIEQMEV